jgi:hypothetical protein
LHRVVDDHPLCGFHYGRWRNSIELMCVKAVERERLQTVYALNYCVAAPWRVLDYGRSREFFLHFVQQWVESPYLRISWPEPTEGVQDLYRFYDADGALLYVGISINAAMRARQHRQGASWWPLVARMEVEHLHVTRRQIEQIELLVIREERPLHNILGVA